MWKLWASHFGIGQFMFLLILLYFCANSRTYLTLRFQQNVNFSKIIVIILKLEPLLNMSITK